MNKLLIILSAMFVLETAAASETNTASPPVPQWKPAFFVPGDQILERMVYYTDNSRDIALFKNGTTVVLPEGLSDAKAKEFALGVLSKIYNNHPDMHPVSMDDGNILVQYSHPAYNVVINDFADKHMSEIRKHHLSALAESEVLITSLGPNKFDDFAMKALYGRTFMFIDAQAPRIVRLYRRVQQINRCSFGGGVNPGNIRQHRHEGETSNSDRGAGDRAQVSLNVPGADMSSTKWIGGPEARALVEKWCGAGAEAWGYSVSHGQLLIRLYREREPVDTLSLYLYFKGCQRVAFDAYWKNVNLEVKSVVGKYGSETEVRDSERMTHLISFQRPATADVYRLSRRLS